MASVKNIENGRVLMDGQATDGPAGSAKYDMRIEYDSDGLRLCEKYDRGFIIKAGEVVTDIDHQPDGCTYFNHKNENLVLDSRDFLKYFNR